MNYTLTVDWDTTEALMRSVLRGEIATVKKDYRTDDEDLLKALVVVHNYFAAHSDHIKED